MLCFRIIMFVLLLSNMYQAYESGSHGRASSEAWCGCHIDELGNFDDVKM